MVRGWGFREDGVLPQGLGFDGRSESGAQVMLLRLKELTLKSFWVWTQGVRWCREGVQEY